MCGTKRRLPRCVWKHVCLLADINLIFSATTQRNCVAAAVSTLGSPHWSVSLSQVFWHKLVWCHCLPLGHRGQVVGEWWYPWVSVSVMPVHLECRKIGCAFGLAWYGFKLLLIRVYISVEISNRNVRLKTLIFDYIPLLLKTKVSLRSSQF